MNRPAADRPELRAARLLPPGWLAGNYTLCHACGRPSCGQPQEHGQPTLCPWCGSARTRFIPKPYEPDPTLSR